MIYYLANVRLPTEKAHGIQIMKMCEALALSGIEINLWVPRRVNPLKDDPFRFYGVRRIFAIQKLFCLDLLWMPVLKSFIFWLETVTFGLTSWWRVLRLDPDVVLYTREALISLWLSLIRKTVFYEIHNVPRRGIWFSQFVWKRACGLIVISRGIKEVLVRLGVPAGKILVSPDAVDLEQFDIKLTKETIREQLGLSQDNKIVLYTGHFYDWKGADTLARAIEFLPSNILVYLVGGTKEDIKRFQTKYQFQNLKIIGWQPPVVIPLWLKAADILILPNSAKEKIGAEYTSPLKLFEYVASGIPIVASNLPAIKEILDSETALFFEADNPQDLADKIKQSLDDYGLSLRRAKSATVKVKEYTWLNRAAGILSFIRNHVG